MDTRLQTFLTLCGTMNYRKAAQLLHLTQPAVTRQIQALEKDYQVTLFHYDGRQLHQTDSCRLLQTYCESLLYNYEAIQKALKPEPSPLFRIGATKTIGDYVLSPYILDFFKNPSNRLSLIVDNTEHLLSMLDHAQLDFAVIEGYFDKHQYHSRLLQKEPFLGICCAGHPFAGQTITIDQLLPETLIVREEGSGTRDILEHELRRLGYPLSSFQKLLYISSFKLIRELVANGIGVSVVYQSVVESDPNFAFFRIRDFYHEHEFNIVSLKNTCADQYAQTFFAKEI